MTAEITLTANAGFRVRSGGRCVYIDSFFSLPGGPAPGAARLAKGDADLVLVTHSHWDHFSAVEVTAAAAATGAAVAGPGLVMRKLRGRSAGLETIELEPVGRRGGGASSARARVRDIDVTAFRTEHSPDHNSYLVEMPGLRFFHDGDNEDTRAIDVAALGRLDVHMFCPWQGSDWARFVRRVGARHLLMMHLTDEEIAQHRAGTFLAELSDDPPPGIVALSPGETISLETGSR